MIDDRLRQLLEANQDDPIVSDCLARTRVEVEQRCYKTGPLPIAHVVRVCSVRAKTNREMNRSRIDGFDELLPELKNTAFPSVEVHAVDFERVWFTVFTDEAVSTLLGILRGPEGGPAMFE